MVEGEGYELLDVVDENDSVIGVAERRAIHLKGLFHRSVHVFVIDRECRIYLQRRSLNKEEHPGKWDSSAAGHVHSGESYSEAAVRELAEELGLDNPVKPLFKIPASEETGREHSMLYTAEIDGERCTPEPNPQEIEEGRFFTREQIHDLLRHAPEQVTPSFTLLLRKYVRV